MLRPELDSAGSVNVTVAYLELERRSHMLPLLEAFHPVTGDQLLSNNPWEISDFGYVGMRHLGYVRATLPLTGRATVQRPPLSWAHRLGQHVRTDSWKPECPGGRIDHPEPGEILDRPPGISGWAMFGGESVTRVEITVNGRTLGRARLGLERPDLAGRCGCADAPISGWEYQLSAEELPRGGGRLVLGGSAYGSRGGRVDFALVDVDLRDALLSPDGNRTTNGARQPAHGLSRLPRRDWQDGGLRILVFTHSLGYGGAQLYLVELLERLSASGADVTIVAPLDGPLRGRLVRAGIAVHLSPAPPGWSRAPYEARVTEVATWAAGKRFDLAIVNTLLAWHGLHVAARLEIPSVFCVHESLDLVDFWNRHLPPRDPQVLEQLEQAVAGAAAVVFEAEATRRLFLPYADQEKLLTLPYGIDLAAIRRFRSSTDRATIRPALGLPRAAAVVLCLGTIEARKAQASLARALGPPLEQHPDAVLALVGQGDDPVSERYRLGLIEHLLRTRRLDRVRIVRLMPEAFKWHTAADVLVCASDSESLPRVILEAMAFDTPVVSTDVFGVPEVIEHGRTGFLVRTRDEGAISAMLGEVLAGAHDLDKITVAAAQRVTTHHDADEYARAFETLVSGVVADDAPVLDSLRT